MVNLDKLKKQEAERQENIRRLERFCCKVEFII